MVRAKRGYRRRFAELVVRLRVEGDTPRRQAASVAVGAFIGCTPLYGLHLPLCIAAGWALGLNRLTMYLAAYLNNPLFAPVLVFVQVQLGSWLRSGHVHALTSAELKSLELWGFAADLAVGSVVTGVVLGLTAGFGTLVVLKRSKARHPFFRALIEETAAPYLDAGLTHWEFVRGKLRGDPVYLHLAGSGLFPRDGLVVDFGCGRGILLALLQSAGRRTSVEAPPDGWTAPPESLVLKGYDSSRSAVRAARIGLGSDVAVERVDVRHLDPPVCRVAVLLDVLHYLPLDSQDRLLDRVVERLEPGGVVIVREADAVGSTAFRWTAAAERLRAIFRGRPLQRFCFRPVADLAARLEGHGLAVETMAMSGDTPFGNVMVVARRPEETAA